VICWLGPDAPLNLAAAPGSAAFVAAGKALEVLLKPRREQAATATASELEAQ